MKAKNDGWYCVRAVRESDSVRFRQLISEINELLDDIDERAEQRLQPGSLPDSIEQ